MNKTVLEKIQELITFYKEKDDVEGMFLTTYLKDNVKILELSVLMLDNMINEEIDCKDNFKIVTTLLTKKDLLLKEENETTLLKLLNATILLDKNKKLSELQSELIKATDSMSLARMNNEMNFYEMPEITSEIKK